MREVRLYGKLGARFGRVHRFDVKSPAEAMRALIANFPALEKYLLESDQKGIRYAVFTGKTNISEKELEQPAGKESIRIAPVLAGSKRAGLFQTVLGAVLVVVDMAFLHTGYLAQIGASMALGGVAQMLTPTPKSSGPNNGANSPSYIFSGAVNTTAVGNPVPVGYGRMIVGSAVISAGIVAEDISTSYTPTVVSQ